MKNLICILILACTQICAGQTVIDTTKLLIDNRFTEKFEHAGQAFTFGLMYSEAEKITEAVVTQETRSAFSAIVWNQEKKDDDYNDVQIYLNDSAIAFGQNKLLGYWVTTVVWIKRRMDTCYKIGWISDVFVSNNEFRTLPDVIEAEGVLADIERRKLLNLLAEN